MIDKTTAYDELFFNMIRAELISAREMFPGTEDIVLAAAEEGGELVKAVLDHKYKNAPMKDILREAVQAAAMAARVVTEGDPTHPFDPHALFGDATDADYVRAFAQGGPPPVADAPETSAPVGPYDAAPYAALGLTPPGANVAPLPDGSAFAVGSTTLPEDHWLTANPDVPNVPPMPFRVGRDNLRLRLAMSERISAAARYAVRRATMNGSSTDFDPDALVWNLLVGMLGYNTSDGLSDEDEGNPVSPKAVLDHVVFKNGDSLA
jgi:hypothetical protein